MGCRTGPGLLRTAAFFVKGTAMHACRVVLRFLGVVPVIVAATVYFVTKEPVRGIDLGARLVSSEPLPGTAMESCTWDVATSERAAFQAPQGGGAAGPGTAYTRDATGNVDPIRAIRSAPLDAPTTLINNPYMIAFDGRRDEVLVPNCVAQPRIAAYSTSADKGAVASRIIEGQNTRLSRTVHAIAYDEIHDEIVVQSNMGQAVVTYRGGANGDEAPLRIIQGPKTLLRDPVSLFIDPVHEEYFVFNAGTDDTMLVYDRMANGDAAPKRVLKGPGMIHGVGAIDPVTNLMFISGQNNGLLVYDRMAEGTTPPLRTIGGGPISGLMAPGRIVVYPGTRSIVVTSSDGNGAREPDTKDLLPGPYVGVWNEDDSGDVPPRYTIAKGHLYMPRGLTLDPKKKTVIVSDQYKYSVMTFSLPELYDHVAASQTAQR